MPDHHLPEPVSRALALWLDHHDDLIPGVIQGLYVVGSAVLDDWQPSSDIDIIAFLPEAPTDDQVKLLEQAHDLTKQATDGVFVDGPRLLWRDVTMPPTALRRPWTLDGEFHYDDGCFELNPVMWHTLANHSVAVRGPDRSKLEVAVSDPALRRFVIENTSSYWRSVAAGVADAAGEQSRTTFAVETTAWCVLGIARMLFTVRTGAVTSKTGAGRWAAEELPQHRELIYHALAIRAGEVTAPDNRETAQAVASYLLDIADVISRCR